MTGLRLDRRARRSAIPSESRASGCPSLLTSCTFLFRRAIEDNVLKTCADLVRNCVAVGHLKPRVVLLVESSASPGEIDADEAQKLKTEVLRRTAEYNSRLLEHERITDPSSILVVPAGSLPRTSVSARSIYSCVSLGLLLTVLIFRLEPYTGERQHSVSAQMVSRKRSYMKLTGVVRLGSQSQRST